MTHKDCFKLLQHTSAHLGKAGHPQTKSLSIRKQSASSFCPAKEQNLVTHYLNRSPSVLEEPYYLSILPAATSTTQYWALHQARAYHRTKHILLRDPISHQIPHPSAAPVVEKSAVRLLTSVVLLTRNTQSGWKDETSDCAQAELSPGNQHSSKALAAGHRRGQKQDILIDIQHTLPTYHSRY